MNSPCTLRRNEVRGYARDAQDDRPTGIELPNWA